MINGKYFIEVVIFECVILMNYSNTSIGAEFVILPGMRKLYDVKIKTLPFDCL